jgi:5-methylcytosine-specific restriction endonuclease McrA
MSRSTNEWIGKHDDAAIPPRVRLRVFERHAGICHISRRRIRAGEPWDCDHIVALCNGGEHRESNLAPALKALHKAKTAADIAEKSRVYRKRAAHLGIRKPSRFACARTGKFKQKIGGGVVLR